MRSRALRAGTWMSLLLGSRHPVLLVRTFILARILTPQDFGLMAIVLIISNIVETIGTVGLRSALIQRTSINDEQLNTAWTFDLAKGLISAAVMIPLAPLIATFFDSPEATNLIRFAALAPVFIGLMNIGTVLLDRNLDLRRKFIIQFGRTVFDVTVSIVLALILRDVWALVYGMVAGAAVSTLLSYILVSYRPRLRFNRDEFRALFGFSSWVVLVRYLKALNGNLDFILIGRMLDVATLGLYQMGWRVSFAVTNAFNSMSIPQIAFASYARVQDDRGRLDRGYQQTAEFVLSLVFPLIAGLVVIAPVLTDVFLGEQWLGAVVPMQILAIAAGARALRSQTTSVLMGVGESRRVFLLDTLVSLTLIGGLFAMIPRWGVEGAAWAVLISIAVAVPLAFWSLRSHLTVGVFGLARPLFVPLVLAGGVVGVGMGLRALLGDSGILAFLVIGSGIAVAYVGGILAAHLLFGRGPLGIALRKDRGKGGRKDRRRPGGRRSPGRPE